MPMIGLLMGAGAAEASGLPPEAATTSSPASATVNGHSMPAVAAAWSIDDASVAPWLGSPTVASAQVATGA